MDTLRQLAATLVIDGFDGETQPLAVIIPYQTFLAMQSEIEAAHKDEGAK